MSLSSYIHGLYSLDTLDKRFTAASRPPNPNRKLEDGRELRSPHSLRENGRKLTEPFHDASASRWKTPEFFLYYIVFLICIPLMFKGAYDASLRKGPSSPLRLQLTVS